MYKNLNKTGFFALFSSLFLIFCLKNFTACGQPTPAQDTTDRVAAAWQRIGSDIRVQLEAGGFSLGNPVFIRAFKKEQQLQLWMQRDSLSGYALFKSYPVCYVPGTLGPKRKEGDLQVPEGVYEIDVFNPKSSYHLSMRVNYPNAADLHFADPEKPGGEIYIHGRCVSVGCLPLGDEAIEEVYLIAQAARQAGHEAIPVHIFPCAMTDEALEKISAQSPRHRFFWQNLQTVYDDFEQHRTLSKVAVTDEGRYQLQN